MLGFLNSGYSVSEFEKPIFFANHNQHRQMLGLTIKKNNKKV